MKTAKVAVRKPGRPSSYSPEIVGRICARLAQGESLRATLADKDMPGLSTCMTWLSERSDFQSEFRERYAQARVQGVEMHIDQIVELADSATPEDVNVRRLQIDTRKWIAAKLVPRLYGDRVAVDADVSGKIETSIDVLELARSVAFLLTMAERKQAGNVIDSESQKLLTVECES